MAETAPDSNPQMPAPTDTAPRTVVGSRVDFSAKLEEFQGPLDLLLYLIKENEVDIANIPIARVLEQYLRFMDQAGQWDLQLAGEFLVMAVTLMEIKSRELLPMQEQPAGEEDEELIEDPRSELVRQLLEYRRLKDQAKALELLAEWWQGHHPRGMDDDIPEPESGDPEADRSAAREALVDVDLYALFAAFEKMMKAVLAQQPRNIVLDSESIEDRIARIEHSLKARPFARFIELVVNPLDRGDIAATFFALLELLRRRSIRLVQHGPYGSFDVKSRDPNSPDDEARTEMEAAEAADRDALKAKAEQDALAAQGIETAGGRFHFTRKRMPPRPKFEGIVRPEDVEEIDAEEVEIGRRIDAILAAADAISERFEQSREGRAREEQPPETQPPQSQTPPPEEKKE